eukprot:TRINITY_DN7803_c0_g1_i1.p2 TRINITY_DN7803_c0_g1~~TRINITY_DN7803_c0_g1_i1.p2  ORF type:complete len:385 (-),score=101.50 TRINITY_DN7803_c0_g1_i1:50-1204(-)
MLRCGSPGYVAPEVLSDLGYGTKADIFSAGIILCIILTGVSPFHGNSFQEVLLKNKSGNVPLTGAHWSFVSAEAKDLVSKLVAKSPQDRCTAKEALQHSWFSLKHTELTSLSNAQENMRRYQNKDRFNMTKIKPEFGMVTCTPLLNSRFNGKESPLFVPRGLHGLGERKGVYDKLLRQRDLEEKKAPLPPRREGPIHFRDITSKYRKHPQKERKVPNAPADNSGNFEEGDIDEKPSGVSEKISAKNPSFFLDNPELTAPMTPSIAAKKALAKVKAMNTPLQNRRTIKKEKRVSYLQQLAGVRVKEEIGCVSDIRFNKNLQRAHPNPFVAEASTDAIGEEVPENAKAVKEGEAKHDSTPKFIAKELHKPQSSDAENKEWDKIPIG